MINAKWLADIGIYGPVSCDIEKRALPLSAVPKDLRDFSIASGGEWESIFYDPDQLPAGEARWWQLLGEIQISFKFADGVYEYRIKPE